MFDEYIISKIIEYLGPADLYLFGRGLPNYTWVIKQMLSDRHQILFVNMSMATFLSDSIVIIKCTEMIKAFILDPITKQISYVGFHENSDGDMNDYIFYIGEDSWENSMINSNVVTKIRDGLLFQFQHCYITSHKVTIIYDFDKFKQLASRISQQDRLSVVSKFDQTNMIANIHIRDRGILVEDIYIPQCIYVHTSSATNYVIQFNGTITDIFDTMVEKAVIKTFRPRLVRPMTININRYMGYITSSSRIVLSASNNVIWMCHSATDFNGKDIFVNDFKVIYGSMDDIK